MICKFQVLLQLLPMLLLLTDLTFVPSPTSAVPSTYLHTYIYIYIHTDMCVYACMRDTYKHVSSCGLVS